MVKECVLFECTLFECMLFECLEPLTLKLCGLVNEWKLYEPNDVEAKLELLIKPELIDLLADGFEVLDLDAVILELLTSKPEPLEPEIKLKLFDGLLLDMLDVLDCLAFIRLEDCLTFVELNDCLALVKLKSLFIDADALEADTLADTPLEALDLDIAVNPIGNKPEPTLAMLFSAEPIMVADSMPFAKSVEASVKP